MEYSKKILEYEFKKLVKHFVPSKSKDYVVIEEISYMYDGYNQCEIKGRYGCDNFL